MHIAPLLTVGGDVALIGYILAFAGLIPIVLAVLVLKPRVPDRAPGQSDAAFWQVAIYPTIPVWALFEGAGILGAVGALLTGLWAPAAVVVISLACLLLMGPGHFENG